MVTESHEPDPSQVPALLSQVEHRIDRFVGDGIFDQAPVYTAVENHSPGARVIVPPCKDAVLSPTATTAPTQRDAHLLAIERASRFGRKRTSGYDAQSYAENVFSRFKRTFGARLRAKREHPRSGRPHWLASCSTGCGNWVVLSPMRSAERGVQETLAPVTRFMQQRHAAPFR
jgi:hypothetical protein